MAVPDAESARPRRKLVLTNISAKKINETQRGNYKTC
jgi:hypothetical protein